MTTTLRKPILFLDLDGTVRHGFSELGRFVNCADDVVIFPEALERIRFYKEAGYAIAPSATRAALPADR